MGLATPRHTHGVENGKQQGKVKGRGERVASYQVNALRLLLRLFLTTAATAGKRDWRGWGLGWVSALRSKALKPHRECMARPIFLPRRRTRARLALLADPVFIFFERSCE